MKVSTFLFISLFFILSPVYAHDGGHVGCCKDCDLGPLHDPEQFWTDPDCSEEPVIDCDVRKSTTLGASIGSTLSQGVDICVGGVVLDCAGNSVHNLRNNDGHDNLVISNCIVTGEISLFQSTGNSLTGNTIRKLFMSNSPSNNLRNNYIGTLVASQSSNIIIENNNVRNQICASCFFTEGDGIFISNSQNAIVRNNNFISKPDPGFNDGTALSLTSSPNAVIEGNFFSVADGVTTAGTKSGISIISSPNSRIEGNIFTKKNFAVSVSSSDNTEIKNNIVTNNRLSGISASKSNKILIKENTVADNSLKFSVDSFPPFNIAISWEDGEEGAISDNFLCNNSGGLSILVGSAPVGGVNSSLVEKNTILNHSRGVGIFVAAGQNNTVKDNLISGHFQGIGISGINNSARNNSIYISKNIGISVGGADNLITENSVFLSGVNATGFLFKKGIVSAGLNSKISRNSVIGSVGIGIHLMSSGNAQLFHNLACSNGLDILNESLPFSTFPTFGDNNTCDTAINWKDASAITKCVNICEIEVTKIVIPNTTCSIPSFEVGPNCLRVPTHSIPRLYQAGPWEFTIEEVNGDGLVVSQLISGPKKLIALMDIRVPRFKIGYGLDKEKVVEFNESDKHNHNQIRIESDTANGIDTLSWDFEKKFNEVDLKGKLCVHYDVVVRWKRRNNCEGNQRDCYRFIPKVSFEWFDESGLQPTLKNFTAYYREDYGTQGLTRTLDRDGRLGFIFVNLGRQPIITKEVSFSAVKDGNTGDYDNIHPASELPERERVTIPGCRDFGFDCLHQHWRWSGVDLFGIELKIGSIFGLGKANPDVLVEPSDDNPIQESLRGIPYLVPGQTIDIVIAKDNPGEFEPTDPFSLVNNETIATTKPQIVVIAPNTIAWENIYTLNRAEDTVVWYVATVKNKFTNTFHRHGFFILDDEEGTSRVILENVLINVTNLPIGSNPINKTKLIELLNESLQNKYWMSDNNTLIPETGENVFILLSNATIMLLEAKNENLNLTEDIDSIISGIYFANYNIVTHTISEAINKENMIILLNESGFPGLENLLINSSKSINLSVEQLLIALNESNINNSVQIIDNFRLAWIFAVNGTIKDADEDIIPDNLDNCPLEFNDQLDSDHDGLGDVCDVCPLDATDICDISENIAANIAPEGGILIVPSNNSEIIIPSESLETDRTIFISGSNKTGVFMTELNASPISLIYTFGPNITLLQFNKSTSVIIRYNESKVFNENNLDIFLLNKTGIFEPQNILCDKIQNKCALNVTELPTAIVAEFAANVTVDTDFPQISLISPPNNSVINNTNNITFLYNVTDATSGISICSLIINACVQPPSSMVGWWSGDGNANDIQNNNHGILQNGTNFTTGMIGQAFILDGIDDFVQVPDLGADLDGFSQLTIDAWINPYILGSDGNVIVSKYDSRINGISYWLDILPDGTLRIAVFEKGGLPISLKGAIFSSSNATIPTDVFTHVAGIWKGGVEFELYVNGVQISGSSNIFDSGPTVMLNSDVDVNLGRFHSSSGSETRPFGHFKGILDEVEIYNRALAAEEIKSIFNAGSFGKCKSENNAIKLNDTTIEEIIEQNFTQFLPNGIYSWKVSCVDNSTNANEGFSETRNLVVNVSVNITDTDGDGIPDEIDPTPEHDVAVSRVVAWRGAAIVNLSANQTTVRKVAVGIVDNLKTHTEVVSVSLNISGLPGFCTASGLGPKTKSISPLSREKYTFIVEFVCYPPGFKGNSILNITAIADHLIQPGDGDETLAQQVNNKDSTTALLRIV